MRKRTKALVYRTQPIVGGLLKYLFIHKKGNDRWPIENMAKTAATRATGTSISEVLRIGMINEDRSAVSAKIEVKKATMSTPKMPEAPAGPRV